MPPWSSGLTSLVHPRAYGEERSPLASRSRASGSPPCVRGRGASILDLRALLRFTPVRTGKSFRALSGSWPSTVHPRAYGEEGTDGCDGMRPTGSPPCVRGRGRALGHLYGRHRFTPVRTGKRTYAAGPCPRTPVHPRAYGEERGPRLGKFPAHGSPPCVRGRARQSAAPLLPSRFTPVRTGKRSCRSARTSCRTVHPRAYGEEAASLIEMMVSTGSPPCVRGRGAPRPPHLQRQRFTPVRTGKR